MATVNDMTFKIAGAAGQGVQSSGVGFSQALAKGGLHVFGLPDYMSRIRGGMNFFQVRVSDEPLYAHEDAIHILLPLSKEGLEAYQHELVRGGGIIYDDGLKVARSTISDRGLKAMPVPLWRLPKSTASG